MVRVRKEKDRRRAGKVAVKRRHLTNQAGLTTKLANRFVLYVKHNNEFVRARVVAKGFQRNYPTEFSTWGQVKAYMAWIAECRGKGIPIIEGYIEDRLKNETVQTIPESAGTPIASSDLVLEPTEKEGADHGENDRGDENREKAEAECGDRAAEEVAAGTPHSGE
jgi:hypothetical protein